MSNGCSPSRSMRSRSSPGSLPWISARPSWSVVCGCPAPGGSKRRAQEVTTHTTMTRSLAELANRLVDLRVERVVMEATSDYWKPVFYLLEAHGLDPWLVNARTSSTCRAGRRPMCWTRCGCARSPSVRCCGPVSCRRGRSEVLRDLTRYRIDLVAARTAEKNRVEKLLEDAGIKLSVVASDIFGVSGRAMMAALIAGERDPGVLADLARARMRAKIQAAGGGVHRPASMSTTGSCWTGCWAGSTPSRPTSRCWTPRSRPTWPLSTSAVQRLDEIPGIGPVAAAIIIAEIGVDMTRFPTAGHLCSWAKFSPGIKSSAGKSKGNGSTGHGNRYLARVLGEAAVDGRTQRHVPGRPIPPDRATTRQEEGHRRGRSLHAGHHLAPPLRPRRPATHDLGADHYARTRQHRGQETQPHPSNSKPSATESPSNPPPDRRHPALPAPPEAAACLATVHFRTRPAPK